MDFNTVYDRKVVQQDFKLPSLTEQSYKDECSIDFIISNFVKTQQDPTEGKKMSFVDCTNVADFDAANNLVANAKSMFYALPSDVRDEFKNIDNYLAYVSNPANLKDCYERNLIDRSSVDVKDIYPQSDTPVTSNVPSSSSEPPVVANSEPVAAATNVS